MLFQDQKRVVNRLEKDVISAKNMYSEALRNLEEISEDIHRQRLEQRNQAELGVRGAGVGSESPSPPPMRGNEPLSIDGKTIQITGSCSTGISQTTVTSSQSGDAFRSSQEVRLPSVIYSSPDKARTPSYRSAIEARHSRYSPESEGSQILDNVDENYSVNLEDEYMSLPSSSSVKDNTDGRKESVLQEDVFQKHPPKDSDKRRESDAKRKKSVQEVSHISEGYVGEVTPKESKVKTGLGEVTSVPSSSEKVKKPPKLQGLILQIGQGANPLSTGAQLRNPNKGSLIRQNTEPMSSQRPASYPYTHNTQVTKKALVTPEEKKKVNRVEEKKAIEEPDMEKNERRLLKAPSIHDFDDTSVSEISDTESVASGTMLDDDQVEFLTMDFSHQRIDSPDVSDRQHWARMSLPANLSHLENYIRQVSSENKTDLSPSEETLKQDSSVGATDKTVDVSPKASGVASSLDRLDEEAENANIEEEAVTRL